MSFREIRNFVERMKVLGYHRLISMDNFRTPNFELVADILFWLVHRYDPNIELPDDISTEQNRVEFLQTVAQVMASKAQIKLKTSQLYRADGFAVRELLKIADILFHAVNSKDKSFQAEAVDFNISSKLDAFKDHQLASDIIDSGSKLFALLSAEEETKKSRDRALSFLESISINLESNDSQKFIEKSIRSSLQEVLDSIGDRQKQCMELETDKRQLQAKLAKKLEQLDLLEKRLKGLTQIKPAFMEEYEALEMELKELYLCYMERYRNLHYLEKELEVYRKLEEEKRNENDRSLKKMQKKFREQELRLMRGENGDMSNTRQTDELDLGFEPERAPRVVGSMLQDDDDDIDNDSDSQDSGTENHPNELGSEYWGQTEEYNQTDERDTYQRQPLRVPLQYDQDDHSQSDNDF